MSDALKRASNAAQSGTAGHRAFETQLASALRNQLNSLQAQRTVLENSDVPAGSVISPAVRPHAGTNLMALVAPIGGALAGLSLGCLIALLMEGLAGSIRSPWEVEELGLPVAAAVSTSRMPRLFRKHDPEAFAVAIRRLRALILDLDPRPDVIAVAPPGDGQSEADVSEAVAESFAKAGHRVVLVRADDRSDDRSGLVVEDGLAQALLYDRLNVMELLESSREPLLCVLPAGRSNAQSREFLTSERLRSVLSPLVEAGNTVVIESPGLGTVEGDAVTGASDLCLVAVTTRRTRTASVAAFVQQIAAKGTPVAALVVGRHDAVRRERLGPVDESSDSKPQQKKSSAPIRKRPVRSKR